MDKGRRRCSAIVLSLLFLLTQNIHATSGQDSSSPPVKLRLTNKQVEIDNGIVKITLSNPTGMIKSIGYKGVHNVLDDRHMEDQRGYWDIMWTRLDRKGRHFDTLACTRFRVIAKTDGQVEVSFRMTWDRSLDQQVPLNIDKRYIVMRGSSGFYSYAIFEHLKGWPDLDVDEARIVFKLHQDLFHYMVISNDMQRIMPTESDIERGQTLAYKEAVLLTNTSNPQVRGEVADKYQYSCENKDNHVHGWISSKPGIGFWVITPSDEFRSGGPMKQDLTSHAGTTSLATFFSDHYAGMAFGVRLRNGEAWKKVFGPIFIYLNSGSSNKAIWDDAKRQSVKETKKWPYDFPLSPDFPHANQRGSIIGRLLVLDGSIPATKLAYVGLAPRGNVGSWQMDAKGYQFWTRSDKRGNFVIRGVRPDIYSLYAWVPGVLGDFKHHLDIIIRPGSLVQIGNIVYNPPRNGPTLWEIGIPDRTAAEFLIPDPSPALVNRMFVNHTEKYRQYGLWDRYTNLYPNQDLVYTVGVSNYRTDWFFAHVNRRVNGNYKPTTWRIVFNARNVTRRGTYTLRLALASANFAEIQVFVNNPNSVRPQFTTKLIGRDNAIARHGIHGLYKLYSVTISGAQLVNGVNTIFLRQSRGSYPLVGVMYDYIRLEGPPQA